MMTHVVYSKSNECTPINRVKSYLVFGKPPYFFTKAPRRSDRMIDKWLKTILAIIALCLFLSLGNHQARAENPWGFGTGKGTFACDPLNGDPQMGSNILRHLA
jgi:hypothetical protein